MISTVVFYNFIVFFSTFLVWLSEKVKTNLQSKLLLFVALLVVILPVGLRYGLGRDYFSYENIFNHIAATGDGGNLEVGFVLVNKLVSYLGFDYWAFTLLFTFLIYFVAMLAYPKGNKALVHFLFLLLLYFQSFNQIRSVLVLSIMLLAIYSYIERKSIIQYLTFVLVAALFHKSALLFLVFPVVDKLVTLRVFRSLGLVIIFVLFSTYFFGGRLVELIFNSDLVGYLTRVDYSESKYSNESSFGTGLGYLGMLFILLYPAIFIKRVLKETPTNKFLLFVIISCLIALLLKKYSIIFGRLELVFYLGYIFSILIAHKSVKLPLRKTYVSLSCFFLFMVFNITIIRGGTDYNSVCLNASKRIMPYTSIFHNGVSITHGSECRL